MCISQMVTGEYVIIPQWRTFPNLAAKAMGEDKVLGSAKAYGFSNSSEAQAP